MSSAKWGKAAGRFEAADTEEELIAALGDVLEALETEDGLTETVEKRTIIKMALEKKRSVPKYADRSHSRHGVSGAAIGQLAALPARPAARAARPLTPASVGRRTVWTKSVMAAYSKILHAYSQPVVPKAAYEGQQFPPAYLFTAPQIDAPESGDDPADSQFAGNFVYKPPSDMKSDIDDAPSFVPLVPSGGQQQSSSPSAPAAAKDDWGDVPPPPKVNVGPPPPPLPSALHKAEAITEYTIDCVNGEEDTTDVWCAAGEAERVTHLNLYHVRSRRLALTSQSSPPPPPQNNVLRIERLEKFPCLLRLTLRSNNLNTLAGVHRAFYLRWLDASVNSAGRARTP